MADNNIVDSIINNYLATTSKPYSLKKLFLERESCIFRECAEIGAASVWKERLKQAVKDKDLNLEDIVKEFPNWTEIRKKFKRIVSEKEKQKSSLTTDASDSISTSLISLSNKNTTSSIIKGNKRRMDDEEISDDERRKRTTMALLKRVEGEVKREGLEGPYTIIMDQYRKKALNLYHEKAILSNNHFLSLVHIYALSRNINSSVSKYFGIQRHSEFVKNIIPDIRSDLDNTFINGWSLNLFKADPANTWIQNTKLVLKTVQNIEDTDMDYNVLAASYLTRIFPSLSNGISSSAYEDTLVQTFIEFLLEPMFESLENIYCNWGTCALANNNTYKPNYLMSIRLDSEKYNLIAVEVMSCSGIYTGPIVQLTKLAIELKIMLDYIIQESPNIENPEVFGILLQGNVCTLYKLTLNGIAQYLYIELATFNLITKSTDLGRLYSIINHMYGFRSIVVKMAERLETSILKKTNCDGNGDEEANSKLLDMIRPNCSYEIDIVQRK